MNIENVVKGLECCTERDKCDKKCPYWNSDKSCWINLKRDALALLKAQEPRDAIVVLNGIGMSGGWWFQCPSCKMEIEPRDRYCKSCGQAVKWDG